jgi:hypothetical protein
MGILADFFVSTTEDALLYEQLLMEEKPFPANRYVRIQSGRLTGLELGLLWAILEGVPWDVDRHLLDTQIPDDVADHIDDEDFEVSSWTEKFPTAFVRQLSLISDGLIGAIAERWGQCEELNCAGSELTETINDLRLLAQTAIETERDLFLWGSL